MIFKKFCEIENSYNEKYLSRFSEFFNNSCVILNKIDGSNISILVDNTGNIRFASRNQLIGDNSFYNHLNVFEKIKNKIVNLSNYIFSVYDDDYDLDTIQFVGEIYGGIYPHPLIKNNNNSIVQKRIYYTPSNDIAFYDIILNYNNGYSEYLDWNIVKKCFEDYNLNMVDVIDENVPFSEAIKRDYCNMPDPTYKKYNLPMIENNFSEGVVIKPMYEIILDNGDRMITKKKSVKFMEKMKHNKKEKTDFNIDDYSDDFKDVYNNILDYVTESRYYSVISKMEPNDIDFKNFGNILRNFNEDVIKDYNKENDNLYNNRDKKEQKIINKEIDKKSSSIIKNKLMGCV